MSNKRKKVCDHISAAKTWLTQAENSLDMDNDIRGDLNLMLAQAELKQAQEAQSRKKKIVWLKRLSPVIVALVLASIWLVTVNWLTQEEAQPVVAEPVVTTTITEPAVTNTASKLLQNPQESNTAVNVDNTETATVGQGGLPEHNQIQVVNPPQPQEPNKVEHTPQTVELPANQVPSEEKQQMMQIAGQLLRE